MLVGKWHVITDTVFEGFAIENHLVGYTGKTDDYFNFSSDGRLYSQEKGALNVSDYKFISNNTVVINSFVAKGSGTGDTAKFLILQRAM